MNLKYFKKIKEKKIDTKNKLNQVFLNECNKKNNKIAILI